MFSGERQRTLRVHTCGDEQSVQRYGQPRENSSVQ